MILKTNLKVSLKKGGLCTKLLNSSKIYKLNEYTQKVLMILHLIKIHGLMKAAPVEIHVFLTM